MCYTTIVAKKVNEMSPPVKFSKDEIVAAALNLTRREGIGAVTARGLGAQLGVSSRPIFTAFRNMEEFTMKY